jgi:ribosomal protein L32
MKWLDQLRARRANHASRPDPEEDLSAPLINEDEIEQYDHDLRIVSSQGLVDEEKLHKRAQKAIVSAAESSLQRIHAIKLGRCPECGHHIRQHLFASICDHCGWNTYEVPRQGSVRVHLSNAQTPVEGERCYVLKSGTVLVVDNDVVRARIPTESVSWVEYLWTPSELASLNRQVLDRMSLLCAWCQKEANPEKDGFHMAQVAFGAAQERYCFCCDECYEAFRKMYPARVHRNCYERDCATCNLCLKRYSDDDDGVRMLAKDYLTMVRQSRAGQDHG